MRQTASIWQRFVRTTSHRSHLEAMSGHKPVPTRWSVRLLCVTLCVAGLSVCTDGPTPPEPDLEESELPTELQVSNLVELTGVASGRVAQILQAEGGDDLVYVALPSGAAPNGVTATVRRLGDEVPIITQVQDGGFDPVAVLAGPTDSVEIVVRKLGGEVVLSSRAPVRPSRPPMVVRTWPPRKKSDMPVNASMVVVFSEPLNKGTVTASSVRLLAGRTEVAGRVRVLDGDATMVAFTPNAALARNREYRLVVGQGITDLSGEAIGSDFVVGFTTGQTTTGPPASVVVQPENVWLIAGTKYQLSAKVFDLAGNLLVDQPVTWSTSVIELSVSATGLVTATTPADTLGGGSVEATANGITGASFVGVVPQPASMEIVPTSATIGAGDTLWLEIIARTASGRRMLAPLTIISSNTAAATIVMRPGEWGLSWYRTLRALNPGSATITAKAGTVSAVAEVTVTPPPAVGTVRVAPATSQMMPQETLRLTAWLRDANGVEIQVSRPISWSSNNTSVLTVDGSGTVTAVSNGSATITAVSEGKSSTASIDVTPQAAAPSFATIDASAWRTCAVTPAADAYCWGRTPLGDGDNTVVMKNRPTLVSGGLDFAAVSPGGIVCGRTVLDDAFCWGNMPHMQSAIPRRFAPGIKFAEISGGACGVATSGVAYCWGANGVGELGDGTTEDRGWTPTQVAGGLTFKSVSARSSMRCGITVAGAAYCWGSGGGLAPSLVVGGLTFAQIAAGVGPEFGGSHTCGITTQGGAYCWGSNFLGQLGDGTQTNRSQPVAVSGSFTFVALSAGDAHTCGITADGAAYCWGNNASGQLGVNAADCQLGACRQPIAVQGNLSFVKIATGERYSCGLTAAGRAYCWGNNSNGALGDGTFTNRSAPTPVARP